MISSGSSASAIAMITRWRMPPDSSCGYARTRCLSMHISSSRSPACANACFFEIRSCACIMSTNWSPTRVTGLSAFIADWKTIETFCQRNVRSSSRDRVTRSSPRKRMLPPVTRAVGGKICIIAFATVLFPQPDSPARPTISPAPIARSTPLTTRVEP